MEKLKTFDVDLKRLLFEVLKRLWLILLVGIICGAGAFAYAKFFITPQYKATATIYIQNYTGENDEKIYSSDLSASQNLVTTYQGLLTSDNVLNRVKEKLGENYSVDAIRASFTAEAVEDTPILKISVSDHDPEELCFYSKATTDFEFMFPFGWGELWGVADRTDYDLTQHQNTSGKDLTYFDPDKNTRYIPYVVEPSLGVERSFLAFLTEAYDEETLEGGDVRTVLHFHPALAPFKAAVLPLSKKLGDKAMEIHNHLAKHFPVDYDETGSIGKRYRREDEIGTPFCITYDFDSENDGCVTVRDRDTMEQVRIKTDDLVSYIEKKLEF